MNQKELNELRRRWKPDKNAISRIYGCFVNGNKEIVTDLDESLGMMTQEESEKYPYPDQRHHTASIPITKINIYVAILPMKILPL